jgi:hypothetical protein
MTSFLHRLILIVPVAKVPAVVAWLVANVDTLTDPDLGPPLNPSGLATDPVTHRWCDGSFDDADCKAILLKLCQLASITPPTVAQWNGWTQAQKIAWLKSVQAAILSGFGAYVTLADNTGVWDDPDAALAVLGLQRMGA